MTVQNSEQTTIFDQVIQNSQYMTTESEQPPSDRVQRALTHLEEWFYTEPQLLVSSHNSMTVKINVGRMGSLELADAVESFVHHNWEIQEFNMNEQTITVCGQASEIPYLDEFSE